LKISQREELAAAWLGGIADCEEGENEQQCEQRTELAG
jgi:hypothetical protein